MSKKKSNFSIITPHAAFLVWNYSDRLGNNEVKHKTDKVDQLIISTVSLKSISTNKTKLSHSGTFEVRLAPTKNWVQVLTPGSWCTILMSRSELTRKDVDATSSTSKADKYKIKMLGRIDSVRISVNVDQSSGATITEYIVTGVDWGSIFNSVLYVDPAMAMDAKNTDTPIGYITQLIYNKHNKAQIMGGAQSTYDNLKILLSMWGSEEIKVGEDDMLLKPEVSLTLPKEVVKFFRFKSPSGKIVNTISDLIHVYHGALRELGSDSYKDSYDNFEESYGVMLGSDILNKNDIWNVMSSVSNIVMNELICDMRWEDDQPTLALYKRLKPFVVNKERITKFNSFVGDTATATIDKNFDKNISLYKNLRRIELPLNEITSFNAGTHWKTRTNFIEMKLTDPNMTDNLTALVRSKSQYYDKKDFSREGLKPYTANVRFFPEAAVRPIIDSARKDAVTSNEEDFKLEEAVKEATQAKKKELKVSSEIRRDKNIYKKPAQKDINSITNWKYLLKEWYFDLHSMLNGVVTFFGQDKYIQVGDNLIMDAKIVGFAQNLNLDQIKNREKAFLLVHVESVSHSFSVDGNGTRHFMTSVNFVRGIITNEKGEEFKPTESNGILDQDVEKIALYEEINYHNSTVKTEMDPD